MKNELPENFQSLTWHQQQGIIRRHKARNLPAHIYSGTGLETLCGHNRPRVTIDPWHRGNPENKPCRKCAAIADKLGLPTSRPTIYA